MILHVNFEELSALRSGARVFLDREEPRCGRVIAPSEERDHVEALVPQLEGDISFSTLGELLAVKTAVEVVVECLRAEMEALVVTTHAADEGAVAAYFDFAHVFTVANRIDDLASEMEALIELVTGGPSTPEIRRTFQFPD